MESPSVSRCVMLRKAIGFRCYSLMVGRANGSVLTDFGNEKPFLKL